MVLERDRFLAPFGDKKVKFTWKGAALVTFLSTQSQNLKARFLNATGSYM